MSHFLTKEVAEQALALVKPVFDTVSSNGLNPPDRINLHVVVLEPGTDLILVEESWGEDPETWTLPYEEIATSKALLCFKNKMNGRDIRNNAPWLHVVGNTRYVGGIYEDGLVVAASGLKDWWDEAISRMVIAAIQAIIRGQVDSIPADASAFLGE